MTKSPTLSPPADFVMVPREPTDAMAWAGGNFLSGQTDNTWGYDMAVNIYRAMIASAPRVEGASNASPSQPVAVRRGSEADAEPSAAFIPGPWTVEDGNYSIGIGFGAPIIASIPGVEHVAWLTRGQPEGGYPYAHLMAAAPDLLEALQFSRERIAAWEGWEIEPDGDPLRHIIDAAIAKALTPSPASHGEKT